MMEGSDSIVHGRNGRIQKAVEVRKLFKPSAPGFPAAAEHADHLAARTRSSSRRDSRLAPSVVRHPLGSARRQHDGRRVSSALPRRCFPAVRRQLQCRQPTVDPSVPSLPKKFHRHKPHPPKWDGILEHSVANKIRTSRAKGLLRVCGYCNFQNPQYKASR
jgi:hypothetical protein